MIDSIESAFDDLENRLATEHTARQRAEARLWTVAVTFFFLGATFGGLYERNRWQPLVVECIGVLQQVEEKLAAHNNGESK